MTTIKNTIKKAKTKTHKNTSYPGFILWEGFSPFDGAPIVAIATMKSVNEKTGNQVQTFIIRTDMKPADAVDQGLDGSVCGDCPFSGGRGCYVSIWQAPRAVYEAYKKGNYKKAGPGEIALIGVNRSVRIGAYGDGAMVPTYIWQELISCAINHTGFTHQYKQPFFDKDLLKICMLSADTVQDSVEFNKMGIRTFTPITENEEIPASAIVCVNTTNPDVQCIDCGLCSGGPNGKSVVVEIHGSKSIINKFTKNRIAVKVA